MFEIESVLMDNDEAIVEEYLDESEQQQPSQDTKQVSPPKKKIPIIRRPGEIVTPFHNRRPGTVKVSPSSSSAPQVAVPSGRVRNTWQRVPPCGISTPPLKVITPRPPQTPRPYPRLITPTKRVDLRDESDEDVDDGQDNGYEVDHSTRRIKKEPTKSSSGKVTLESLDAKLNALDEKLNQIMAKLGEHDGALKAVKYHVKDLRNELTNIRSMDDRKEQATARAPKRRRQPQITFPVTDDNHLQTLEELVQADNGIREELYDRFLEAPGSDVYHYMRKNVGHLFNNTSKYTWTGKPPYNAKDKTPSGIAQKLSVVDILIDSGCEKFAQYNRDDMEKEFRRSLDRLNNANCNRAIRRAKEAMLTQLMAAAVSGGQENKESGSGEDEEEMEEVVEEV